MADPRRPASEAAVFADRFELPDGIVHERCAPPLVALTPHKHWTMTLPGDLGRATLDTYVAPGQDAVYSRAVSMKTGAVAWFRVTPAAPAPTPTAAPTDATPTTAATPGTPVPGSPRSPRPT